MDESIGGALLTGIITAIVGIMIVIFAVSFSYNKAYKARSFILNLINDNDGYSSDLDQRINDKLLSVGYNRRRSVCANKKGRDSSTIVHEGNGYCIYKLVEQYKDTIDDSYTKFSYYEIETYMTLDIPLFLIEIPIYGQTQSYRIIND